MWAFVTQKPTQATEEEKEALAVEPKEENEPKIEMILDLELWEDEQIQSQPLGGMKVFLGQFNAGDIEATQEKPHQLEDRVPLHKNQHSQKILLRLPLNWKQLSWRLI